MPANQSVSGDTPENYVEFGDIKTPSSPGFRESVILEKQKTKHVLAFSELKLGKELGAGAFGVVRRGKWRGMDVAVKELKNMSDLSADAIAEFEAEAETMGSMTPHQNVVQFLGVVPDPLCLVTEFCRQGSLFDILADAKRPLPLPDRLRFMVDVAKGMAHLGAEGVVHKDLASRNVLITEHGVGKVADFGLARLVFGGDAASADSSDAMMVYVGKSDVGPLRWMAPESLKNRVYSTQSDIWSFGVTCIEIMTRTKPYPHVPDSKAFVANWEEHTSNVYSEHFSADASEPANSEMGTITPSSELQAVLSKCFAPDPSNRSTFRKLAKSFESLMGTDSDTDSDTSSLKSTTSEESEEITGSAASELTELSESNEESQDWTEEESSD